MLKRILTYVPFLTLMFCTVYAGVSEWRPDFTPQCGRDENKRNKYLEDEKSSVEHSLAEMEKRGINIIPTPKNLFFSGKDINISRSDAAGKITVYADKTTSQIPVDMICQHLGKISDIKELPNNVGSPEISVVLLRKDTDGKNPMLPKDIPDFYQGYVIKTLDNNGKRTYVLAGKDYTGLLYAAVTFRKLVALKDNSINFPAFNVSDWPDIRYRNSGSLMYPFRQAFWFSKNKSSESAKKFIDWLLDHKINMTSGTQEDCDDLLLKEEERKWLKEVCEYAKARGIYVEWLTKTAVGVCRDEKEDKMGKDCIRYSGLYYCWSNDELINKRAQEMVQYLKDTGLSAIFIHSMDTTNSKWQDRCQSCRDKFGDDRFSGDAYVFNHYRDEIRKSFPDMPITIVPRPYNKSIDDISHVQSGEIKSKDDLKRFSKMLAEDVYVCHRETDRTASLSWVNVFKQPMNTCTMAWYLSVPFLIGRDFTPVCRYFRTYNYPLSNEMASYIVHSSTRDKIQCLGFVEYSWNLNAPGSAEYSETPEEYKQIWDPFGKDMLKNRELQAFIKRACNELFAPQYAKYFYNKFLLFTDRYFVDNYQEVRYALEKGSNPQPGMMPDIDDSKCIDFMRRCYDNSNIIIKDLEELKGKTTDQDIVGAVNRFLAWQYEERAVSHIYMLILEAEQASKEGNHEKAGKLIKDACQASDDDPKQLKADWHKIQGQADEILVKIPQDPEELKKHKIFLDMIKTRIQSREMMSKRKKNAGVEKNETPKANKPVSAAVFAPDSQGGLTYGRTGLLNLLKGINDISVEEIDNLSLETLKKYDCVIIPDCKSFGKLNVNMNDIRSYVIDHGGGMYFEHDSCGFNRFPLKSSLFPEIADAKDRIGEPISSARYKKSDRTLKIVKQHPVTAGYAEGTFYEQVYFDHIQLTNELGTVLVEDTYGKPVIIAGQAEKGKVVFNGGITLSAMDDSELDKPLSGIEGELILNCIYWLAKDKKGTELIMSGLKKEEKILPDRGASVISFNPQIVPCRPLHEVILSVQCFNAKDSLPISPKIKIAKIDEIAEKWESEETVIVNADSYPQVRVVMELSSKEGRGRVSMLVGGN